MKLCILDVKEEYWKYLISKILYIKNSLKDTFTFWNRFEISEVIIVSRVGHVDDGVRLIDFKVVGQIHLECVHYGDIGYCEDNNVGWDAITAINLFGFKDGHHKSIYDYIYNYLSSYDVHVYGVYFYSKDGDNKVYEYSKVDSYSRKDNHHRIYI